ncbi:MAG: FAD/NAD(P)-binding oxidoreductase, partial [Candidatus Thiodiazotropha sp.]
MTLQAEIEEFQGDVINIIPPQKAGKVAFASDLTEGDWCPVDKLTFESSKHKNVYILGDASSAAKMPKSAYAANSQAKVAAAAIVSRSSLFASAMENPGSPLPLRRSSMLRSRWRARERRALLFLRS